MGPEDKPGKHTRSRPSFRKLTFPLGEADNQINKYLIFYQLVESTKKENRQKRQNGKEFSDKVTLDSKEQLMIINANIINSSC